MGGMQRFRSSDPDQLLLLPTDMRQWLPEDDLVYFIIDVVGEVDLSAIYKAYDHRRGGGPAYEPRLMVSLLLYAYCVGLPSSRRIEQATYHSIPFRILTGGLHPDHDTIAAFRQRHLKALAALFVQVLRLCQQAGLVKLGHVSLDGTKVTANASKHKAMSYQRITKKIEELEGEVEVLLNQAQRIDAVEDAEHGRGHRRDDLPKELRFREQRLKRLRQAKEALEARARDEAQAQRPEYEEKKAAWESRKGPRGRPPKEPSDQPDAKCQYNFTDAESRIMPQGKTNFVQGYNCQAAADAHAQIIVATQVSQQSPDQPQLPEMVERIKANLDGAVPKKLSADAGYFSQTNVECLEGHDIDAYLATGRQAHGDKPPPVPRGRIPAHATVKQRMARKLQTIKGKRVYSQRKHIVEPPFGQIKEARGLRRFSLRGLANVGAEWDLWTLTHNLLKLFRSGGLPATA